MRLSAGLDGIFAPLPLTASLCLVLRAPLLLQSLSSAVEFKGPWPSADAQFLTVSILETFGASMSDT